MNIVYLLLGIILFLLLVVSPIVSIIIYNKTYNVRFMTGKWQKSSISDYPNLEVEECSFKSNKGQNLRGYTYKIKGVAPKAVVVFSHGFGGGGQVEYLDLLNEVAKMGYYVFSYDATACEKSEGKGIGGLPQGVIDLEYALNYVKNNPLFKDLSILTLGHSWGAYNVMCVLNKFKEVKGVIEIAGFNHPSLMFLQEGSKLVGSFICHIFNFYVNLYEAYKFRKYAKFTSISGMKNSSAKIFIISSDNDKMVETRVGYDLFYQEFKNDKRFKFLLIKGRGHAYNYYTDDSYTYRQEKEELFKKYLKDNHLKYSEEEHDKFLLANVSKKKAYVMDQAILKSFNEFYEYCLGSNN